MESVRKIAKVWKSKPTIEGAGVHLKRAFGNSQVPQFDPFLLLDDFHSDYPPFYLKGFPWHPHRGIETITYVIHGRVEVICGRVNGVQGPVRDVVVDPEYLDVTVPPETTFTHPVKRGYTAFAYVVDGEGYFDPERNAYAHEVVGVNYFDMKRDCACDAENLILYGDGDAVAITTQDRPVRFILVSGQPIGEPVAWYGPIVMNSQEELQIAFEEYQKGTFIKHT